MTGKMFDPSKVLICRKTLRTENPNGDVAAIAATATTERGDTHRDLFKEPRMVAPNVENNPNKSDLRIKTAKWINDNPKIAKLFLEMARQLQKQGKKFGAKYLAEKVRWEYSFRYGDEFKISNNNTAYIARWLIKQDPSLESCMKFREVSW